MVMTTLQKDWLHKYPPTLLRALGTVAHRWPGILYVAGGAVRDWLQGRNGRDLDITVAVDGVGCAEQLAHLLNATLVILDPEEDVARVVWQGYEIDISSFREGTTSIEADLLKRDFTINAMAVALDSGHPGLLTLTPSELIDPAGGLDDLGKGLIRCASPAVFASDPLRLLRAHRFAATLGFAIEKTTGRHIERLANSIVAVSVERLRYELDLIMASSRAAATFTAMQGNSLLFQLFPELQAGVAMAQPDSHHLDVFSHSLATLEAMEAIQQRPEAYFPGHGQELEDYLMRPRQKIRLKWAALFHDLGKPAAHRLRSDKGDRITFYNHDRIGGQLVRQIAQRYKWSQQDTGQVAVLISMHMWPFHLNNVRRKSTLMPRAYLRLVKKAGPELAGLFLLAMADSMAGQGAGKPAGMEEGMRELYDEAVRVYRNNIEPVLSRPLLLNGHDLLDLSLPAGPLFNRILNELQEAQVEGRVANRIEALQWVKKYVSDNGQS